MTGGLVELVAALKWRLSEIQDAERQAAEKRLGVDAGDEAVQDDPRYSVTMVVIGDAQESLDSVLVLARSPQAPAPPSWVTGGPDRDGEYNGPAFHLDFGVAVYTTWSAVRGARLWVDSVPAERHMGVGDALALMRAVAEAAALVEVTR